MRIKLLMVCSGLVPGGKERQLIEVVKSLDKDKFTIGIITFNKNQHYSNQAKQFSFYFKELYKRPTRFEPLFTIWSCFKEFNPDIVHSWDTISSFYCFLPCKILGIPLIDGSIRDAGIDKGIFYFLKRALLLRANEIIANSMAGLKAYNTNGIVIYNIINTDRFLSQSETNEFNLIMTANFSKFKDHETFLKAAIILVQEKTVDQVFLLGEGIYREKYILWLKNNYPAERNHFHFPGAVRNVEQYLAKCRIGVLCSTVAYSEGLSNSVLEYMSAGLVPIVTNLGGSPEIISDCYNGYLIKPGDFHRIVEYVRILKSDPDFLRLIATRARNTIETKFSMINNLKLHTDLYINQVEKRD
jgi:glycosyltransferase involved in cell wall biosynthesis